jgi:hypothetical protein
MKNFTKPFLLMAFFFLCISNVSFSQIKFGPRIGLNFSDIAGVNTNAHFKAGLHLGGYARIGGEKFSFQPELLFSMKGYQFKNGGYKESLNLNYIDVPLMVRMGGKLGVLLGVQPSFLLGFKYKNNMPGYINLPKNTFNTFDFGILSGLEYELGSGLNFGARFGFGLLPIFHSDLYKKVINLNGQLTLGYTLGKD